MIYIARKRGFLDSLHRALYGNDQIERVKVGSDVMLISSLLWIHHQYRKDIPEHTASKIALSTMELHLGVFRFLPTTHAETNTNKMRPRCLSTVQRFMGVYLHAQTTTHTHLTNHNSPVSQYERPRAVALASFACVDKTTKIITEFTCKDLFYIWNEQIKYCKRYHYEVNRSVLHENC